MDLNIDEIAVMEDDGSIYFRSDEAAITWYSHQFSKLNEENKVMREALDKMWGDDNE